MIEPAFLLDTNICIYLLEGLSPSARDRMQECRLGQVVTSAIAYAEVMRGVDPTNAKALADTARFFHIVQVLPFDGQAALAYGRIPFRRGRFDRLIAAHALSAGLTVVTNNEDDFADIPDLKVENWTLPLA